MSPLHDRLLLRAAGTCLRPTQICISWLSTKGHWCCVSAWIRWGISGIASIFGFWLPCRYFKYAAPTKGQLFRALINGIIFFSSFFFLLCMGDWPNLEPWDYFLVWIFYLPAILLLSKRSEPLWAFLGWLYRFVLHCFPGIGLALSDFCCVLVFAASQAHLGVSRSVADWDFEKDWILSILKHPSINWELIILRSIQGLSWPMEATPVWMLAIHQLRGCGSLPYLSCCKNYFLNYF